jgi:hypothetical protein
MPYCVPQDVRDLHQLITVTDFDDPYVQKYINKAVARINDHLKPFYVVPLTGTIPDIITSITADMAAAFLCQHHFSGINYREDTPLAEVFRKRAEADLIHCTEHATLDDLPGIVKQEPDVPEMRQRFASSTPKPSPLKKRLERFDNATHSPISRTRNWL